MRKSVKIGIGLLGVLVGIGLVGLFSGPATIFGDGVKLDVQETELEGEGFTVEIGNLSYVEENQEEILSGFNGYGGVEGFVLADVRVTNTSETSSKWEGLQVKVRGDELGDSLEIYRDQSLPYATDVSVMEKYRLLVNGEEFRPGESRTGHVYIPLDAEWASDVQEGMLVDVGSGETTDVYKVEHKLTEEDLKDSWTVGTGSETELEDTQEVVEDSIGNGMKEGVRDVQWDVEGVQVSVDDVTYYEEIQESFREGLYHLVSMNGTEKVVALDVEVVNTSDKDVRVEPFKLTWENGEEESVVTVGAPKLGNEVVLETFREENGLLNYRGHGDTERLAKGESVKGKVVFLSSDWSPMTVVNVSMEGSEAQEIVLP